MTPEELYKNIREQCYIDDKIDYEKAQKLFDEGIPTLDGYNEVFRQMYERINGIRQQYIPAVASMRVQHVLDETIAQASRIHDLRKRNKIDEDWLSIHSLFQLCSEVLRDSEQNP